MTALPDNAGKVLLTWARNSIAAALGQPAGPPPEPADWLFQMGASFVTLKIEGSLRGCIGTLTARQSLEWDVQENAVAAALHDPRFPALTPAEFKKIHIEVSVLSAPRPLAFTSRADALAKLRPGLDGVVLKAGPHRATFLPQVWEELPEPEVFISHLMRKASLASSYWGDDVRLEIYSVTAFEE